PVGYTQLPAMRILESFRPSPATLASLRKFAPKQTLASQGSVSPLPVRLVREKRRENQRCESSIRGPSSSSVSGTEIGLSWSVSPSPVKEQMFCTQSRSASVG
ncbi:hypothetical protein Prudu_007224, partial [Prunus dulcis]